MAALRLDLLLCRDLLLTNSELASADAQTWVFVQAASRRIALARSKTKAMGPASSLEHSNDPGAAERNPTLAPVATHTADAN